MANDDDKLTTCPFCLEDTITTGCPICFPDSNKWEQFCDIVESIHSDLALAFNDPQWIEAVFAILQMRDRDDIHYVIGYNHIDGTPRLGMFHSDWGTVTISHLETNLYTIVDWGLSLDKTELEEYSLVDFILDCLEGTTIETMSFWD